MSEKITIELTRNEYDTLLFMTGYATGASVKAGERKQADSFLRLANAINRDNPDWTVYEVPEDESL